MPRSSNGTYTLPVAAFIPGGLIKSSDLNSNYSDIATAITQSLATTGVSTMTGPIKAAAGTAAVPGITFNGALATGFYLAGTNQIGWASNGVQGATFNADTSVNLAGNLTVAGTITNIGSMPIGTVVDFAGAAAPSGWLLCFGQLVSTTTYATLFAALGTTYGSGSGTFGIPDYRGRATFGKDNMGGSTAGRITATVNFDGTVLGNSGGGQSSTLGTGNLPAYTPSGGISNNGGVNNFLGGNQNMTSFSAGSGGAEIWVAFPNGTVTGLGAAVFAGNAQGGTSTAFSNLSPGIITNKIIFAGL